MRSSLKGLVPLALSMVAGAALLLSAPTAASQGPAANDVQLNNRQLLDQWKRDPAHYNRLLDDLQAFKAMSPEKQARIRRLDTELRQAPPATRQHLWTVMERYHDWLKDLKPTKRQYIEAATSEKEKLERVRKVREEEWYRGLPEKAREDLDSIKDTQLKAERQAQLRALERFRRKEWLHDPTVRAPLPRHPKPAKLSEFPLEVQFYYDRCLDPLLTAQERDEVQKAGEKPWPALARQLMEKADKYPLSIPGPVGKVRLADLTPAQRAQLGSNKPAVQQKLKAVEGKWPEFALAVLDLGPRGRNGIFELDVMPATIEFFPAAVRDFVLDELYIVLTPAEKEELNRARTRWPDFPRTIVRLAEQHKKVVPMMKLPGPPDLWERASHGG